MKRFLMLFAIAGAVTGAQAYALFDFESEAATTSGALTSLTMTDDGLTLTLYRQGGAGFDIRDLNTGVYPLTWDDRALDPFANASTNDWFIGNFSNVVSQVEVEMTDFGGDGDVMVLEVYSGLDATGTLIATSTLSWGGNTSPSYMAVGWSSVFNPGAAQSIRFRGGSSGFPNSMFYDNIAAVPEPASIAALLVGSAALLRRRKK